MRREIRRILIDDQSKNSLRTSLERRSGGDEEAPLGYWGSAVIKHEPSRYDRRLGDGFSCSGLGNGTEQIDYFNRCVAIRERPERVGYPEEQNMGSILLEVDGVNRSDQPVAFDLEKWVRGDR